MRIFNLGAFKLHPLHNLVAFVWLKCKITEAGLIIPEQFYDIGLKVGRFYLGKVLATGKKVKEIKKDDVIMIHEYGIKNFSGTWQEDYIYFIEEKNCKCKLVGLKEKVPLILRVSSTKEEGCG